MLPGVMCFILTENNNPFRGKNNRLKKMTIKVSGETPVQILAHSFVVSQSESGYTFAYSGDGINWTEYTDATPANEDLIVNGIAWGTYIKLVGNSSEVTINY